MFYLILLFLWLLPLVLRHFARQQTFGMKGQMPHPFNILGAFTAIIGFDFLDSWWQVDGVRGARLGSMWIYNQGEVLFGLIFFCLCMLSVVAGIYVALKVKRKRPFLRPYDDQQVVTILFVIVISAASFVSFVVLKESLQYGSIFHVATTRQIWFRENQIFQFIVLMVLPAFFMFLSRHNHWPIIISAVAITTAILALNGGRLTLLMIAIAYVFKIAQTRRLPLFYLYSAIPVVGIFLIAYLYFVRLNGNYSDLGAFLATNGGISGSLFGTLDISIAEAISINLSEPLIDRSPYSFLVGGLIAFIPRSWIPWKLYGASAEFTMTADLNRWLLVKSEWTITGFANLYYDFGYAGAIVVSAILAYFWTRLLLSSSRNTISLLFGGVFCIHAMTVFIRADLYNLGLLLWSYLVVLGIYYLIRITTRLIKGQTSNRTANWCHQPKPL